MTMIEALELAKALTKMLGGKSEAVKLAADLRDVAIEALDSKMRAQEALSQLQARNRELEEEVLRIADWELEKVRYKLKTVSPGTTTYVLDAVREGGEPPHWICTNCYQDSRKSILQYAGREQNAQPMASVWVCPRCTGKILVRESVNPDRPWQPSQPNT